MPPSALPAGDGGARRPLNPFLSKDPDQRAKRLARALVSDIITYHPAKHAEGLRDGTLKQLFREEIKKSFEEYIAQVGQQLAESTTYFQEALNEVLGAGKKIF
jgi:L-amino acid N-acyltransferase YncA